MRKFGKKPNTPSFDPEHISAVHEYYEGGVRPHNIVIFMEKRFGVEYSVENIEQMISCGTETNQNSRAVEFAASIVFDAHKRKRIKVGLLFALCAFVIGMILLGVFVSWIPVAIVAGAILLLIIAFVVTVFILIKSGWTDRML